MLPDGPGDRPMYCDCCVIKKQLTRHLNGPDSVVLACPSSRNALVMKNGVLRPMYGIYTGPIDGVTRSFTGGASHAMR